MKNFSTSLVCNRKAKARDCVNIMSTNLHCLNKVSYQWVLQVTLLADVHLA